MATQDCKLRLVEAEEEWKKSSRGRWAFSAVSPEVLLPTAPLCPETWALPPVPASSLSSPWRDRKVEPLLSSDSIQVLIMFHVPCVLKPLPARPCSCSLHKLSPVTPPKGRPCPCYYIRRLETEEGTRCRQDRKDGLSGESKV